MRIVDKSSEAALIRYGEYWRSKSLLSRIYDVLRWRFGTIWAGIVGAVSPGERQLLAMCKQIQDERDAARVEACLRYYGCLPAPGDARLLRSAAQKLFALDEADAARLFPGERA